MYEKNVGAVTSQIFMLRLLTEKRLQLRELSIKTHLLSLGKSSLWVEARAIQRDTWRIFGMTPGSNSSVELLFIISI
jgi:hypothetical protein